MQVDAADVENWTDILQVPELPRAGQRWTVQRKAAVVEAVRGGWMPIGAPWFQRAYRPVASFGEQAELTVYARQPGVALPQPPPP